MTPPAPLPAHRIFFLVLAPFAAAYFLSYLFRTVNAAIAPLLAEALGIGAAGLGVLTSVYFLSFAAFQLPLGVLLDRFGPRRVDSVLMLIAAFGAILFAAGATLGELILARALIGLGVSACLMSAFKANVMWWPKARLPLVNGIVYACGGLGALSSTAPVAYLVAIYDWRTLFFGLAVLAATVAALIYLVVPRERETSGDAASFRDQLRGVGEVFRSRAFWRVAPVLFFAQGAYLAYQSLWAGAWLRDVALLPEAAVANHLAAMNAMMVAGAIGLGMLADRLSRIGIGAINFAALCVAGFIANEVLLLVAPPSWALALWMGYGFLGAGQIILFAGLSQSFRPALAGRVGTAANLSIFAGVFAIQPALGVILDHGPGPGGHALGLGLLVAAQVAALLWLVLGQER